MIILYHGSGAGDFGILPGGLPAAETRALLSKVTRVLRGRGEERAVQILAASTFEIDAADNHFNDDFYVLRTVVPLARYEELRSTQSDPEMRAAFRVIAEVIGELQGPYIRFIVAETDLEAKPAPAPAAGLSETEINKLVYKYIGVEGGYLEGFSGKSHHEFYIDLDLPINPYDYTGTTRERFIAILKDAIPSVQATILDGILRRYPVGSSSRRTQELHDQISHWLFRLRGTPVVESPNLRTTSAVVERALRDIEDLLRASGGAPSSVDRAHTALHGYLRAACSECGLTISETETLTTLLKRLRESHPNLRDLGPRPDDMMRVLRALSTIVDALNPLRNQASVAHPNETLLPQPEAMLVVNAVRTILHYLDSKLRPTSETTPKKIPGA
jgi:hypothetical protein